MPFKRQFKDKYAGSSPENASVVRTLFDLFLSFSADVSCLYIHFMTAKGYVSRTKFDERVSIVSLILSSVVITAA